MASTITQQSAGACAEVGYSHRGEFERKQSQQIKLGKVLSTMYRITHTQAFAAAIVSITWMWAACTSETSQRQTPDAGNITPAVCGNDAVEAPDEECDDGNTVTEDSCPEGVGACVICTAECTELELTRLQGCPWGQCELPAIAILPRNFIEPLFSPGLVPTSTTSPEVTLYLQEPNNLLENGGNETGDLTGWTIVEEDAAEVAGGGSGWHAHTGLFGQHGFTTALAYNRRSQLIDLLANGHHADRLDRAPPIAIREWYIGVSPIFEDNYYLRAELRDADGEVLAEIDLGTRDEPRYGARHWQVATHVFENYGPGVRFVYLEDGARGPDFDAGHDPRLLQFEFTGPHMGARIDGAVVAVGSIEMRISNNNTDWSDWMPFASRHDWTLEGDAGEKTVYVQFRDAQGQEQAAQASFVLEDPS